MTFKTHLIGCADCTAGDLCATGQALFDARLGVPDYLVFAHHGVPYPGDWTGPVSSAAKPVPDVLALEAHCLGCNRGIASPTTGRIAGRCSYCGGRMVATKGAWSMTPGASPAPVSPAEEPTPAGTNTHCDRSTAVVCALPAGHDGSCIGAIRQRKPTPSAPSRETTQREEWVVQEQSTRPNDPKVWTDFVREDDRTEAEDAYRYQSKYYTPPARSLRFRLVHRVITETVVEGPTE